MSHQSARNIAYRLFQLWEVLVFVAAFAAGILAVDAVGLWDTESLSLLSQVGLIAVLGGLWIALLHSSGLYTSRRIVDRGSETLSVLGAVVIAGGTLSVVGALLNFPTNEGLFQKWFLSVSSVGLLGGRFACRAFLHAARAHGRNLRFVAIAGAGIDGQRLAHKINSSASNGFHLIGLFDEPAMLDALDDRFPRGGSFEDLRYRLMREPLDEVLIALPMANNYDEIMHMLAYCERVGVSARVINEFVNHTARGVSLEYIDDTASLQFSSETDWGWQGKAKVAMDWVLATGALIVLSPLLILVAALIKLDSPGPVFFTQLRVGKNRKHFKFFKFRTMVQNAEALQAGLEAKNEAGGPVFKMRDDPRITKLGAFLRRYSIDELPQLINVVLGDMSLVGPRPLPLRDVQLFEQDWHSRRFSVRPGLTCSWVLAGRSELEFDEWVEMDLEYIDNWSLKKDVSICLNTIPRVLKGAGAY